MVVSAIAGTATARLATIPAAATSEAYFLFIVFEAKLNMSFLNGLVRKLEDLKKGYIQFC